VLLLLLRCCLVCCALQDTPGYGDDLDIMNHINMINGHINACNEKWLTLESARDRTQDLTEVRCCCGASAVCCCCAVAMFVCLLTAWRLDGMLVSCMCRHHLTISLPPECVSLLVSHCRSTMPTTPVIVEAPCLHADR
jgi:hypothetical protein